MKSGYHSDVPMHVYLADPCEEPALSSSIVTELCNGTAKRAHMAHPRFGGINRDYGPRADKGSAVHSLLHGGYPVEAVTKVSKRSGKDAGVEFEPYDWKTQDAQDARDALRAANKIPVLPRDLQSLNLAANSARKVIETLGAGSHEQTMIFRVGNVWGRSRTDWLSDGPVIIPSMDLECTKRLDLDTKTVEVADEIAWLKSNADEQSAQLGLRWLGHLALTGEEIDMGWLLQEIEPPYDNVIVLATREMIEIGVRKAKHAARIWRKCLDEKSWPGKTRKAVRANPPAWLLWELENRGIE